MIRLYKDLDRLRVLEIFKLNTPAFFDSGEQKNLERYLDLYADTYFVVEKDNIVVECGGYHFTDEKTVGRISWDVIHPDSKGQGLGKRLILYCMDRVKAEQ